jgi:hypothetical protein
VNFQTFVEIGLTFSLIGNLALAMACVWNTAAINGLRREVQRNGGR